MVVRRDSWAAIAWAFSIVPPFSRYAVMPVARNVWQQVPTDRLADFARRFTQAEHVVGRHPDSGERAAAAVARTKERGLLLARVEMPAAATYACA